MSEYKHVQYGYEITFIPDKGESMQDCERRMLDYMQRGILGSEFVEEISSDGSVIVRRLTDHRP